MKSFELEYLALEPFMPSLHQKARLEVRRLTTGSVEMPKILDVGGRKSHYTVGVRGRITISDLPRETPLQRALNLGLTMQMRSQLFSRSRTTRSAFADASRSAICPGKLRFSAR